MSYDGNKIIIRMTTYQKKIVHKLDFVDKNRNNYFLNLLIFNTIYVVK